jgi:hypothetical protein
MSRTQLGSQDPFERVAGACAIVAGIGGLAYAVAFVIILRSAPKAAATTSSVFLLVGGLLSAVVIVALYQRLRTTDPSFALLGLQLGTVAAVGSAIHGGFDLANLINKPGSELGNLPNPVDPRGLLTFGVTALAIAVFAWLITRNDSMPRRLGHLGFVSAALLVVIYLGRLIVLNPKSPGLLVAALLAGFVVNPAWYVWLGRELFRGSPSFTGIDLER